MKRKQITTEQKQVRKLKAPKSRKNLLNNKTKAITEQICSRCGKKGDVIHHIDGNYFNNKPDNLSILCSKCHSLVHDSISKEHGRFFGRSGVAKNIRYALKELKIDLSKPDFRETPQRIARVWEEFLEGTTKEAKQRVRYILSRRFPSNYKGMIILTPIQAFSLCPHHFLPVYMKISFGYIPNKYVIGLSKISELIILLSKQPILQESLTEKIAELFTKYVKPKGCMLVIEAMHTCMGCRDTKQPNCATITSSIKGVFSKEKVRAEFMRHIE